MQFLLREYFVNLSLANPHPEKRIWLDPSILPYDTESGTLLRGRYLSKEKTQQIVKPEAVIDGLLQNIFRIKNVLDAVIAVVGLATVLAIILVFALSLRLRQREIQTIFKIGCSRMTIANLITECRRFSQGIRHG